MHADKKPRTVRCKAPKRVFGQDSSKLVGVITACNC